MSKFVSVLRQPDVVLVQTDNSNGRFEEEKPAVDVRVDYTVENGAANVVVYPSSEAIKRVKLRWNGDFSFVRMVLGDDWERTSDLRWTSIHPDKPHPWYLHAWDGEATHCWGVKTGPNAMCYWQLDPFGLCLWVDVRCGGEGVQLKEALNACTVVEREGKEGESAWQASIAFCHMMCEKPALPKTPVFGANNWYWAYGRIDHNQTMQECDYLTALCEGTTHKPYMVIDDGWQDARFSGKHFSYNGGPWYRSNASYPGGMQETADGIKARGARPGIWFRPLLTLDNRLPAGVEFMKKTAANGQVLDPSHPFTLEQIHKDVSRIASWGFELLKHDFSTYDTLHVAPGEDGWHFYDRSKTTAQILKELYRTIQNAMGDALVIGCNTIGHLAAGIHAIQRTGGDTSGRLFEVTRKNGLNVFLRVPQNGIFFNVDPDCAAFTEKVPHDLNLDFMEVCAITGSALFASITPNSLTKAEFARAQAIYHEADKLENPAEITDWMWTDCPSRFLYKGEERVYNWYRHYNGTRQYYTWFG